MKVSVVVPVYNKAPYLQACFESLFAQTYRDIELIAVDDASTDDSLEQLRAFDDPRLRIIALDRNVGPGLAAQRGIDEAVGEYILRADADDVQFPDRIAAQVQLLDGRSEIGAVSAQMVVMDRPENVYRLPLEHEALRVELLFGVALYQGVMAVRRSVLHEHGIRYREQWPFFGEDRLFELELSRVTRMANLDRPLMAYRIGPQNSATGRDRHADLALLTRHAFAHFGLPITDEEIDLHLYTARFFAQPPDAARIRAFRAWLHRLRTLNDERQVFDPALFQERLDRAWDELFHRIPEFGWRTTFAYLMHRPKLTPARSYYLLATLLKGYRHTGR
jgi:glycosyltransferase involved in cell wall biosynthesis